MTIISSRTTFTHGRGVSRITATPQSQLTMTSLLSALPGLPRRDLLTLRAALDRLLGAPAATAGPLYDAVLSAAGVKLPFSRFLATKAGKSYSENEKLVLGWLDQTWPGIHQVQKVALLNFLLGQLVLDLKRRQLPVTVSTLAFNLGSVPALCEKCFPDYIGSGLAEIILKAMVRK
jgi:hypothetical protein